MEVSEIIKTIESIAPLSGAAPWDKSGMQVAATRQQATHLAVMLDPTVSAMHTAIAKGADMLLAHHPLAMQPRFPDTLDSYHESLALLFSQNIPLYSAHTSLDSNPSGPAGWLADALHLKDRVILEELAPGCGFGIAGTLPAPLAYTAFTDNLATLLGIQKWRTCGPYAETITRIAYCPGSGGDLINAAANAGADLYITGDIKYHIALEAKVTTLDVGHFCLEHIMMRHFADFLRNKLPQLTISFFDSNDPFRLCAVQKPSPAGSSSM